MITALQITDTHLFANDDGKLLGVNTNHNFYKIIDHIKQQQINPDIVLLTGDLSHDDSEASYEILVKKLSELQKPVYWIPGNHDHFAVADKIFSHSSLFHYQPVLQVHHWNFIFLDTTLPNKSEGYLGDARLGELDEYLATAHGLSVIVMHHHPIETQSPLIDRYILQDREQFWRTVTPHSHAKLIICGHVHGDFRLYHQGITIESAPATCLQWPKGAVMQGVIEREMGYKIYRFGEKNYEVSTYLWNF